MSFEGPDRAGDHYRPEIDGLRAIAVLAVMLYHADLLWASGGFVGVDIFFVISGYLITGIIFRETLAGKFSAIRFYERRARRILPALFVVLAASILPALLYFDPAELQGFGSSLGASALFSANFYFWRTAGGYFALTVDRLPLLHLWSLAVEEQFYLLYPPLFLLAWRFARKWLFGLIVAAIGMSLALSEYASVAAPVANFFLPATRAWELLAGCALAVHEARKRGAHSPPGAAAQGAGFLGLTLLLVPVFLYDDTTFFPGVYALPIVIGTLLVVRYAHKGSLVVKFLASGPLVAIGLVSYSVYLWHQPILAFARTISLNEVPSLARAILLVLSFVLAWLSWHLVEKPFRRRDFLTSRQIWFLAGSGSLGILLIGAALWATKGLPDRLSPRMQEFAQMNARYSAKINPCFISPETIAAMNESCKLGLHGPVELAVIGDSHAMTLAPAFEPMLRARGRRGALLVAAGCPPVLDYRILNNFQLHCPEFTRRALDHVKSNPQITTVVLAARWTYNIERSFQDNGQGGVEIGPAANWEQPPSISKFATALQAVVRELSASGKQVVLIYPVPEPGWDVPRYLVRAESLGIEVGEDFSLSHERFKKRSRAAYRMLDKVGQPDEILRLYPERGLCNEVAKRCLLVSDSGTLLYFDDDHLSIEGAELALPDLDAALAQ